MTDHSATSMLVDALPRYPVAYLLTVSDSATPHAVEVTARLAAGLVEITGHGRRSTANAGARPSVTVLFPAADAGGQALIVDGRAAVAEGRLLITVTRAILHRSAGAEDPGDPDKCRSQCVELSF